MRCTLFALPVMALSFLVGCGGAKTGDDHKKHEEEIKQAFASLQDAVKAKDVDKFWGMLTPDTQADAERQAKLLKERYEKENDKEKKETLEKKFGLTSKEISELSGKLYAKS